MDCDGSSCRRELSQQDERSVGPIANDEYVCRAAFWDGDYKKSGEIKEAFIPNSHLKAGQISVWRMDGISDKSFEDIVPLLRPREGSEVRDLLALRASIVRRIATAYPRVCVLDECEIDDLGGFHELHAHVTICRSVEFTEEDKKSKEFQDARIQIGRAFIRGAKWRTTSD